MSKIFPIAIALIVLECTCINVSGQRRKNNEQLYLMTTEVIKADKIKQYVQAREALIPLLQETGFPYPFIIWSSGDTLFHVWYPVNKLNDIQQIDKAWEAFKEHHASDVLEPIHECIETSINQVMLAKLDLIYEPAGLPLADHETDFCRMKQIYLETGSKQEVKALTRQLIELIHSKGLNYGFYCGEGMLGFEIPVVLNWSFASDLQGYLQQEVHMEELLGTDFQKIHQEVLQHVRKTEIIDFNYVNGLTYNIY